MISHLSFNIVAWCEHILKLSCISVSSRAGPCYNDTIFYCFQQTRLCSSECSTPLPKTSWLVEAIEWYWSHTIDSLCETDGLSCVCGTCVISTEPNLLVRHTPRLFNRTLLKPCSHWEVIKRCRLRISMMFWSFRLLYTKWKWNLRPGETNSFSCGFGGGGGVPQLTGCDPILARPYLWN